MQVNSRRKATNPNHGDLHRKVDKSSEAVDATRLNVSFLICLHVSGVAGDGEQQPPGAEAERLSLGPGGFHHPGKELDGLVELHSACVPFIWLCSLDRS